MRLLLLFGILPWWMCVAKIYRIPKGLGCCGNRHHGTVLFPCSAQRPNDQVGGLFRSWGSGCYLGLLGVPAIGIAVRLFACISSRWSEDTAAIRDAVMLKHAPKLARKGDVLQVNTSGEHGCDLLVIEPGKSAAYLCDKELEMSGFCSLDEYINVLGNGRQ